MKYTEQAVETLDDAGSVIANKNIEIEQLRQRVAELENERDRLSELCDKWNFECDDMREDNNRLANVVDALKQQRDELLAALEKFLDDNNPEGFGCACAKSALASSTKSYSPK